MGSIYLKKSGVYNATSKANKTSSAKRVLGIVFSLILIFACFVLFFRVGTITVTGNNKISQQKLMDASGIKKGDHILKVNIPEAKKNISRVAYVDKVNVGLSFPNRVEINITESKPSAYISFAGGYISIDGNGKVLETGNAVQKGIRLPEFKGIKITKFTIGEKIYVDENQIFDIIILCLNEFNRLNIINKIDMVDLTNPNQIILMSDKLFIECGSTDKLAYKLTMLAKVLENLGDKAVGRLDLTESGKAVFKVN